MVPAIAPMMMLQTRKATARLPWPLWLAMRISAYAIPMDTMVTAIIVEIASARPASSESATRSRFLSW
jgi:hypothetical protein